MLLIVSLVAIGLTGPARLAPERLDDAVAALVRALPGLFDWFWEICDTTLAVWAVTLVLVALFARGRKGLFRDQLLAAACATLGAALLVDEGVSLLDGLSVTGPPPIAPAVRLAVAVAVITTTSPHLGRPVRRVGRWVIVLGAASGLALAETTLVGVITGLALGYGAAALIHLILGSSGGRPTEGSVVEALGDLGVPVLDLHPAALAPRGVAVMEATTGDGRSVLVKVYGRDAWSGQLLIVTWSYLWYRDDTPSLTLSRLQQVEHEAFVTLLAERAGVPVQPVVAAGSTGGDAVLVVENRGQRLTTIGGEELGDELIRDLWRSVMRLHAAGIAHGSLDADHLAVLPEGTSVIRDLAGATAAASGSQQRSDDAQLLATTALLVGVEPAVSVALAELGSEGLAALLPYLQGPAFTRGTRTRLKERGSFLDDLRERAATAAGAEVPKLEPLRRVTWGSLVLVALLLFGAWAILSVLSDVGLETILDELVTADAAWLWAALIVSLGVQLGEAMSTLGACPRPLRLGPVIGLQFAIKFIQLAVPSSAARVSLNVRFFQRVGLQTSTAIAVGVIDGVSGFLVQAVLVTLIWIAGLASLEISTDGLSLDIDPRIILAIVIGAVVLIVIAVMIPRVRKAILPRISEGAEALQVLRSPTKVFLLFAGNLAAQVILAVVLGLCLRAFGAHASLAELILVNTLASLLAGVLPVPGGIGVMEATIAAGLAATGIPETTALSTALVFRLVTFYLPPIWGAVAMRMLRRNEYV